MPSHWTDMPPHARVAYVELPLPPGCSPAYTAPADQPSLPPLDEETLKAMMYQVWGRSHLCHGVREIYKALVSGQICSLPYSD